MHPIEVRSGRLLVAAIGLLVAALVYLDAQRPATGQATVASDGAVEERASSADEAEAAIAQAGLGARMEAALGDAFGGVWFEPSTAQMHVGVTSPQSRRRAGEVAARAGLSGIVTETAVDSTWQQLDAAQARWDHRLGELFGRGEVTTAVAPDLNAVKINLSSTVPASRRAVLERETANAAVAVSIETQPRPSLLVRPDERQCASWLPGIADCDPTIPGGVRIEPVKIATLCTAGPTVARKDRSTAAKATETLLLTAGHCIHNFNGVGEKWRAFNKEAEGKDIGDALTFLFGGTDLGVVKVDQTYWADRKSVV